MSSPLLELIGVSKSFPAGDVRIEVLREAHLSLERGSSTAIMGPSGSGKSTILNLIGTLDRPDAGSILFEGKDLATLTPTAQAEFRNRSLGFIFQSHHLLPHCTVLENTLVPCLACADRIEDAVLDRARRLLDRVGLGHRLDHLPSRLSGGERQRVAVVRSLIRSPALVLADEPTGALDRASAADVTRLLLELQSELATTLLVVTHSPELAGRMSRVLRMEDGKLVPENALRQPPATKAG
jgi:ABC-type lipoprotein export system ATPase subunit